MTTMTKENTQNMERENKRENKSSEKKEVTDSREVKGGLGWGMEREQRRRDDVGGTRCPGRMLKLHLISHCMLVTGSG